MLNVQIKDEKEILDPSFRKRIITEEIMGAENRQRKQEAFKRYEILKNRDDRWVVHLLSNWFDSSTIEEMSYSISNISIGKKINEKKSRVYNNGVKRTVPDQKKQTQSVEALADHLKLNTKMKKADKYLNHFFNTLVGILPKPIRQMDDSFKWDVSVDAMAPFFYDVIEKPEDKEEPWIVILSNFKPDNGIQTSLDPATEGRTGRSVMTPSKRGDGKDQTIADTPTDAPSQIYTWWSPKYHFITDENGKQLPNENNQLDVENPIKKLPFVNLAKEQDGAYWALGGNDVTDESIKINTLLSHINHIAITQGYGQMFMTGGTGTLPKQIKVGPTVAIQMEYDPKSEEPKPDFDFKNANPPLLELLSVVETKTAILLATNNLSTRHFAADLKGGAQQAASGIALLIDKSESNESIEDQAEIFRDNEPSVFECAKTWYEVFKKKKLLTEDAAALKMPAETKSINLRFPDPQPIMSEMEQLDIIEKRRELGLNREIELLMMDDPSLDEKDALKKLQEITDERMARLEEAMAEGLNGDQDKEGDRVKEEDDLDDKDNGRSKPKQKGKEKAPK